MTLADKTAPYTLTRAIRIEKGALKIGPGVRIEGKEITLANGSLHLAGTKEEPIRINVKVSNRRGPAIELIAQNCHFLDHFAANSCKKLLLDRCTFEKTVRMEPTGMRMATLSYRVTNSEFKDTKLSAVLRASYSADKLEMAIENCNIFGPINYRTDMFSRITIKGCSFSENKVLRGLRVAGDMNEISPATGRLSGVGAGRSSGAGTGTRTGGSIWAQETPGAGTGGRQVAINEKMGFTIEYPSEWKTATNGQLILGPFALARPKVEVKAAPPGLTPNKVIEDLIAELKKKGAKAVKSSPTTKGFHPAGVSWARMVGYDAAGWRYRKKYVSVAAPGKLYIIEATFRDDKAIEVGPSIDSIVMSFKVK